jgi:hypothetical protein
MALPFRQHCGRNAADSHRSEQAAPVAAACQHIARTRRQRRRSTSSSEEGCPPGIGLPDRGAAGDHHSAILQLRSNRLAEIVDPDVDLLVVPSPGDDGQFLTMTMPAQLKRAGKETALLIEGQIRRRPDRNLLGLLAKAQIFHQMVMQGEGKTMRALAKEAGVARSYFTRLFRLSFLAPDVVQAILQGDHPLISPPNVFRCTPSSPMLGPISDDSSASAYHPQQETAAAPR